MVQKLNKSIHPVFKINNFIINENKTETEAKNINLSLLVDIEGGLSDFKGDNTFIMPIYLEKDGKNITIGIICDVGHPNEVQNNYIINCSSNKKEIFKPGDNAYLLPIYILWTLNSPFEVIINKIYKYPPESPVHPTGYSSFIKMPLIGFISFMLLF